MFDFRYHALSLVAVFVALTIGLLLGIAIGDQGLVSSAEQNLREGLRGDVSEARAESARLSEALDRRQRYEELTLPALIGGRLEGQRVNLLFLDERSEPIFDDVRAAVETAGGSLGLVGTIAAPLDLEELGSAASGTNYEALPDDPSLLDDFGRRLGSQMIRGGRLLDSVRGPLFSASSGSVASSSALVVVRAPGEEREGEDGERHETLVDAMLEGVTEAGGAIAGVEESTADPSQIAWYRDRDLASVDNVDEVPGRASLAVVLAGQADGAYGIKDTRDAYVPDELIRLP